MTHLTDASDTTPPPIMARTDPRRRWERRPYKIRGRETWALIRESYLAGASARQLAARYDATEWAIGRRAWRESWTRRDRVEPTPPPALERLTPEAGAAPETADAASLSREALKGGGGAARGAAGRGPATGPAGGVSGAGGWRTGAGR